jgi:alpha-galactosidase
MAIKIAMIGAGSIGFTRRLMRDILAVPELQDTQFAFTDLSRRNLGMVTRLCQRDIEFNKLPAKITATTDRRRAIADADYIICTIRQGGLEAFQSDIDIPLKYGVDQCVGDTLCAGGIMYGQRTIAAMLEFCCDIRELARPGAILLNYSNPMAMNTWACNEFGKVRTIGLCHGVQGAHWQITQAIELWAKLTGAIPMDYASAGGEAREAWMDKRVKFGMHRREVDVVFAGLNHQTWCLKAIWRGMDMTGRLHEFMSDVEGFRRTEKVRLDVLKRLGYYSTESNGHLSEYLPWYRKRTGQIKNWIDLSSWINGETGGYLRVCTEGRNWFQTDFPNWLKETSPKIGPQDRSEEHGSYIIEACETGRVYRGHFNVVNQGRITNLPDDCVVEIPGYVDRTGINMPTVGALPLGCAATLNATVSVQRLSVHAAVSGDVMLLKQAMLHDPLTGAVCDPEEIWQLTDEMLIAQSRWLPQYKGQIAAAKKRLADAVKSGTRARLIKTQGAARIHTRTVREMKRNAAEAKANAAAADKGKMTGESASGKKK